MEKNKFRNHISVVLENGMRSIVVIFFAFVGNFLRGSEDSGDMGDGVLYIGLALLGILIVLLVWQILIWAKTYISVQGNTLVVERNTLNKKKNTIGLKNVSNVNLEQNLFEMLLGTCKVKLDTNTLTTADQTDVKIVLKKKDAEEFKKMILGKMDEEEIQVKEESQKKYMAEMEDIIVHGVFSLSLVSVMILVGVIAGVINTISDLSLESIQGNVTETILTILVAVWVLGGLAWKVVKGFVQYVDFTVERREDKIYMNYGLLKKVAYSVPVDKINGVQLIQTGIARLGKRYTVEVINVGMGDDDNESQSFFLPYAKKEQIEARIQMLLPEFADCMKIQEQKQDKSIWTIWIPGMIGYLLVMAAIWGVVVELMPEMFLAASLGVGIGTLIVLLIRIAGYLTKGIAVHENALKIINGSFARRILFVKYEKIQYITAKQNWIAKKYKLQKGSIHLLAASKNTIHDLPYFTEEKMEELKRRII